MADLITTTYLTNSIPLLSGRADLAELVTVASNQVENYCGRTFAYGTGLVDYLDGTHTPRIWVLRPPIVTLTSVVYNGTTLVENTDFLVNYDVGRITRGDGRWDPDLMPLSWWVGTRNVVVSYAGGYSTIPHPVQMATALAAQHIALATSAPFKSERLDNYSYTRADVDADLPPAAMALLSAYRRVPVGSRG